MAHFNPERNQGLAMPIWQIAGGTFDLVAPLTSMRRTQFHLISYVARQLPMEVFCGPQVGAEIFE
jgi:hypothetical protein